MLRASLLVVVLATACTDDGSALTTDSLPFPTFNGSPANVFGTLYDDEGSAWILTQGFQNAIYHLEGGAWTQSIGSNGIASSSTVMSWEPLSNTLYLMNESGLWASSGQSFLQRWISDGTNYPIKLLGATGNYAWYLALETASSDSYLARLDVSSGTVMRMHSGKITVNNPEEAQGLQLGDGRLMIVHDPIDNEAIWIASSDGMLAAASWNCTPTCTKVPELITGTQNQIMAFVGQGIVDYNYVTGLGAERYSLSWPTFETNTPLNQAYAGIAGTPVVLADGRAFMLVRELGSASTSLLATIQDGGKWRKVQAGLPATYVLEGEDDDVLWIRNMAQTGDGLVRVRL